MYSVKPQVTGFSRNFAPGLMHNGYGDLGGIKSQYGIATFFASDNGSIAQADLWWRTCYSPYTCGPY